MVRIERNLAETVTKPIMPNTVVTVTEPAGATDLKVETATAPAVRSHAATASQVADFLEDPKNGFRRLDVREIVKTLRIRARG